VSAESEPDLAAVVGSLDDEYARSVLAATGREPTSATEIADRCDASVSTVYRRAERLQEVGLVTACELTLQRWFRSSVRLLQLVGLVLIARSLHARG